MFNKDVTFTLHDATDAQEFDLETSRNDLDTTTFDTQTMVDIISMLDPNLRFPKCLKGLYSEDQFFRKIAAHAGEYQNFVVQNGLYFLKQESGELLCIPSGLVNKKSVREAIISHAHSLLAHLGGQKTFYYLRDHVWWPQMFKDVIDFCSTCHTCATADTAYGLLHPLNSTVKKMATSRYRDRYRAQATDTESLT